MVGQEPMVRTLTNAFETGRIAQAYMLTGVRGVGKTTTARILARALNYKTAEIDKPTIDLRIPGEHCQAIMEGRHVDVIEMDAASHTGIDDIREIIEQVRYRPVSARYKVYIIDEVHMLSTQAFNGLLLDSGAVFDSTPPTLAILAALAIFAGYGFVNGLAPAKPHHAGELHFNFLFSSIIFIVMLNNQIVSFHCGFGVFFYKLLQ